MSELFKRVKDIQTKAADSEVLVQEICRDIRKVGQHSSEAQQTQRDPAGHSCKADQHSSRCTSCSCHEQTRPCQRNVLLHLYVVLACRKYLPSGAVIIPYYPHVCMACTASKSAAYQHARFQTQPNNAGRRAAWLQLADTPPHAIACLCSWTMPSGT